MKFTKKELDEIKDALEDSMKYYKDLLDESTSDEETKKMSIEYAHSRIKIIESILNKLKITDQQKRRSSLFKAP